MATHAELASKLLEAAASFFRALGEQNAELQQQMDENADVYAQLADFITRDPRGSIDGTPYAELAGKLLTDAATFFRSLAAQNAEIKEDMEEKAEVYEEMGRLVAADPLGVMD